MEVRDNGVGIPAEVLSKVGKFKITSKNKFGNGIGLAHAYRRLESWGGSIQIQSTEKLGTQVLLFLPLIEADISEDYDA